MKLNRFLALFLLLLTSVFSSEKFTMTYGDILKGDVRSIGGTLLENSRIDRHRMKYKDLDNDHTTRNSSYGWLGLNKNKKIVYAKLYWWGATKSIAKNGEESVKVKLPYEKRYKTVYADDIYKDDYYYLGVKDITNDLKNHHKGKVWVSNNYIKEGKYALAGWTLVVVYKNQSKSNKEIIIYDGLDRVTNTHDVKISFKKHSRKEQSISVGTFGGNRHTNGDSMFFNETPVKRYGRTDNLFVGFAFWYDNAIAMDYFSTLTNIQQDDLEITFKTKKDQHLPFVMVYRNTIENEETRAFQKGEIEEKNNSKWVKITSLFETRKGRKKEIKELVYQTHVPNYSTADTDSFKTNGEKTPPKKKGYGYDVYIGDSDKAKVTYTLKVPKNKSTKNIESDLKSCFKYNYIYQNNRREICSNRTLFTGKKEDIKYQKELEEARLLE
ncbi:MAG: DUF3344 domain-containing protein, partial [Campylobacterales bacterium]|nr:DUF3344 domain-containing protein [Campylobacterales bacterium]